MIPLNSKENYQIVEISIAFTMNLFMPHKMSEKYYLKDYASLSL